MSVSLAHTINPFIKTLITTYQQSRSVCSVIGRWTESVCSSRDDRDVVSQWRRSWNVDIGGRCYTSCYSRLRRVRSTFSPISSLYVTAGPGHRPARRPSLESLASSVAGWRRRTTQPTADTPLSATRSSWTSSSIASKFKHPPQTSRGSACKPIGLFLSSRATMATSLPQTLWLLFASLPIMHGFRRRCAFRLARDISWTFLVRSYQQRQCVFTQKNATII